MQNWRPLEREGLGASHQYFTSPPQDQNIKSHPCCICNGINLSPPWATASSLGFVPSSYECWLVHPASTLKQQVKQLFLSLTFLYHLEEKGLSSFFWMSFLPLARDMDHQREITFSGSVFGWFSIHSCSFPIPTFFSQYSQTVDGSWFWTHFLVPWFFHFYYRFWASPVCNIIIFFLMKSSVILLNSCSLPSFLCRYLLALR